MQSRAPSLVSRNFSDKNLVRRQEQHDEKHVDIDPRERHGGEGTSASPLQEPYPVPDDP